MKKLYKKSWLSFIYSLDKEFLSPNSLKNALSKYWNEIILEMNENDYILTQFIVAVGDTYLSISVVQNHSKNDYDKLLDSFVEYLSIKIENNSISGIDVDDIDSIIFKYYYLSNEDNRNKSSIHLPKFNNTIDEININERKMYKNFGYNLPSTMDILSWGDIIHEGKNNYHIQKYKSKLSYYIDLYDDHMDIELKNNGITILKFVDYPDLESENPLLNFKRFIYRKVKDMKQIKYELKYIHYFENGNKFLQKVIKKVNFLKTKTKDEFMSTNIITMDLETRAIDGYMWPYAVSIFDGSDYKSFYQSDYINSREMIENSIMYLFNDKYNKFIVFIHNFSYFDSVFLLKSLHKVSDKIRPVIRDGRFINTKIFYKKVQLSIIDSMLLVPAPLAKLAKSFNLENKGIFPYTFVDDLLSKKIDLNYFGNIPRFKFFDLKKDMYPSYIEYVSNFKNKLWNLRDETIKYSELDVKILYNILIQFNERIFSNFGVDAFKYPTISSLAFAIYRTNYLNNFKIPLINGKIYSDLKLGYTGGACDVYRPYSYFKKIYGYDVNSLYPSVMAKELMPVGAPTYFEGDITKIMNDAFGFFEVEINAPDNLYIPLLQTKLKTENGKRTISPVGSWIGIYFSEELKEAIKLGYEIKILRGYLFDKENIFKECIETLYNLKENSIRGSADYLIYKLLMNSLYGRFGMSPIMDSHIILDNYTAEEKYYKNDRLIITNVIELDNFDHLISFHNKLNDFNKELNISIPISSAITSYSRILMSKFKNLYTDNIYYSDTDSIYLDTKLDSKFISDSKLGLFKLERIFENAIFLAPKMYAGRFINKFGLYENYAKIKGVKINVNLNKLIRLLFENEHFNIVQEKWFRDFDQGTIMKDSKSKHTLTLSSFKRKIIYKNKKFTDTKPVKLSNCKII